MNESDSKNPRRLARAIEKALDGNTQTKILGIEKDYDVFKIILTAPLAYLYERVDKRVASRMEQGMLAEARELNEKILSLPRMKQLGLEYGIMADYLSGVITTPTQLEGILKLKIRHFVKRQQTWFKKEKEGLWVDISKGYLDRVEKLVGKWYDTKA
ncbi:hypothetical protein A3E86_00935 [Candidatus Daviesbacteria bacterium RIFCSPHIGHO2_12_FULL_47_45]|nr:MAG: hypothetical protein A3E86_00935 [Candidatus Daviesbacteria bacterium RIFCSPHIGHO2_12_FULL_47_45]